MEKKRRTIKILFIFLVLFAVAYGSAFLANNVSADNKQEVKTFLPDGVPKLAHDNEEALDKDSKATGEEQPELTEYDIGRAIADYAEQFLGVPYTDAGVSPKTGFDCSGFVYYVLNHTGHPTSARGTVELYNAATIVPASERLPGDIVFFHSTFGTKPVTHVGIYIGNNMMVHAGTNGEVIKNVNLSDAYWIEHFLCYGRIR